MEQGTSSKMHKLAMTNRKKIELTGVEDVVSFDMEEVVLETSLGMLTLKGEDLKVNRLSIDKGELDVEGRVNSMMYTEVSSFGKKKESVIKRMFK